MRGGTRLKRPSSSRVLSCVSRARSRQTSSRHGQRQMGLLCAPINPIVIRNVCMLVCACVIGCGCSFEGMLVGERECVCACVCVCVCVRVRVCTNVNVAFCNTHYIAAHLQSTRAMREVVPCVSRSVSTANTHVHAFARHAISGTRKD